MVSLPEKIIAIHKALATAAIPHAFGGALALAWCTQRARGTVDIDINIFVHASRSKEVFNTLPRTVMWHARDLKAVSKDGQVRLWWDNTPVDVFLNTTDFHNEASERVRWESFAGSNVPFLSCRDLAVFKAFFNRSRDWVDLEEMQAAGTLNADHVLGTLVRFLGGDDERIERLRALGN
ncbi:MAG: hypothetical protein ACR2P1_27295 [Pseudomonadales bacterium]